MRIDYIVKHFPKGICKSHVSVFTEILQSRLYKEPKAILWGNMLFLESCVTGLNRFATSNFSESVRDVLQVFAHWKFCNISYIFYSVGHSEFVFIKNLANQYPITVFYIHYSLHFCFKKEGKIGSMKDVGYLCSGKGSVLGGEFWKFTDPVISLWPGFHPLFPF